MGLILVAAWKSWAMVILPVIDFKKCQSLFLFCTVSGKVAEIADESFRTLFQGLSPSQLGD